MSQCSGGAWREKVNNEMLAAQHLSFTVKTSYTQRIYGIQKNCWGISNYGGSVTVSDVSVSQY